MTFGEVPWLPNVPESAKGKIMHAQLPITEAVHLMASDFVEGVSPGKFVRGNDFNILRLSPKTKPKPTAPFRCSAKAASTHAARHAPWGPYFGMCTDRFGVQWMVSCPSPRDSAKNSVCPKHENWLACRAMGFRCCRSWC